MSNSSQKKILFVYKGGVTEESLASQTSFPQEFLFGYHDLKKQFDCDYIFLEKEQEVKGIVFRLLSPVKRIFSYVTRLGMPLEIFFTHRKKLKETDVIFCVNEAVSFGVLFYKLFGLISADVVVVVMSLQERVKYFQKRKWMIWFLSTLLSKASRLLTLSDYAQQPLIDIFHIPKQKIETLYFGIDTDFWYPEKDVGEEPFILAIGNDMNRDFQTLVRALPDELPLTIITKKHVETDGKKVTLRPDWLTNEEVRTMYSQALCVVVPSIALQNESSGLSCALQTLACARPLIISDAPPLKEVCKDQEDCLYYVAEDVQSLRMQIERFLSDKELRKRLAVHGHDTVIKHFTTKQMAVRLGEILTHTT